MSYENHTVYEVKYSFSKSGLCKDRLVAHDAFIAIMEVKRRRMIHHGVEDLDYYRVDSVTPICSFDDWKEESDDHKT